MRPFLFSGLFWRSRYTKYGGALDLIALEICLQGEVNLP